MTEEQPDALSDDSQRASARKRRLKPRPLSNAIVVLLALGLVIGLVTGWVSFDLPWDPSVTTTVLYDEDLVTSLFESASRAVVEIRVARGSRYDTGSGFFVDGAGHIVTNHHVVDGRGDVTVELYDGRIIEASRLGTSPADDLALLQVDPAAVDGLSWLTLADSDSVRPGQMAIAIGSPFDNLNSVTVGIVSGVGRSRPRQLGQSSQGAIIRPLPDLVQTDAALNPGNSGGPLLNSEGEVIGVNSSVVVVSRVQIGVGFAISSNTLKGILPDLMEFGVLKRAYIGIRGTATRDVSGTLNLGTDRGVYINEVLIGSPADAAKLIGDPRNAGVGDIVVSVDGRDISSMADMVSHLNTLRPGDHITVRILRDGKPRDVDVTLAEWPDL